MSNIAYQTDQIARFFESNRIRWDQFYESERTIFEQVAERFGPPRILLDAGCAAGGLGLALQERFGTLESYTGVDINPQVITESERRTKPWQKFICGDVATIALPNQSFPWVTSLSCADWNLEPELTVRRLWEKVSPDGFLIISLRLTELAGTCDPTVSYQPIAYDDESEGAETANYVVLNVADALSFLASLKPDIVLGYGYWGKPAKTAVTPYERLAFTVFAVHKPGPPGAETLASRIELNFPIDLLAGLQWGNTLRANPSAN